ncbi:MAG: fructokinase [Celeribacter sp.]|jgi:fructokinase
MSVKALVEQIKHLPEQGGARHLIAVAGAPGSGKSTLADALAEALILDGTTTCVVPMDGFHLDNSILQTRGVLDRKGAPETFDATGFQRMILALTSRQDVVIPTFDRARDIAIAGARVVEAQTDVIIIEGNYLLFDDPNWRGLTDHWSLSVRLDVPIDVLRQRLVQRWLDHGLEADQAVQRAESNDLANATRIVDQALPADITVHSANFDTIS